MARPVDCTIGPTTADAQTIPECRDIQLLPRSALTVAHSREENEDDFWQKAVLSSPTTAMEANSLVRHLDSLEDLIVEKWVDESTGPAPRVLHRGNRPSLGISLRKSARSNPLTPRKKENKKTRSSTSESVVASLPHKRGDILRKALLRYRNYFLKSAEGASPQHQIITGAGIPKKLSALPRELLIAYALFQCAQFRHGRVIHNGNVSGLPQLQYLESHDREVERCVPTRGKGRSFTDTTDEGTVDDLDLERTREWFSQATIEDDYDMTDQ